MVIMMLNLGNSEPNLKSVNEHITGFPRKGVYVMCYITKSSWWASTVNCICNYKQITNVKKNMFFFDVRNPKLRKREKRCKSKDFSCNCHMHPILSKPSFRLTWWYCMCTLKTTHFMCLLTGVILYIRTVLLIGTYFSVSNTLLSLSSMYFCHFLLPAVLSCQSVYFSFNLRPRIYFCNELVSISIFLTDLEHMQ